MTQPSLQACQELLGYEFTDLEVLALALTHASVAPTRTESNERLEFLGDAVLGIAVVDHLYRTCEDFMEGEMTKIKSSVVSRRTCAAIARDLGLCEHIVLGKGMVESRKLPTSVAAAVLEAVIGAIYLDGGFEPACRFVLKHVAPYIDQVIQDEHGLNYKSRLQQYAQKRWGLAPEYRLMDEKGPDHSKCFEVAVSIDGKHFPGAWGMNKKEAEQKAARQALQSLGVLDEEPLCDSLQGE